MDNLGNRLHVNFLGYAYWFISIRIYQIKDHCISAYQAIYATYIVVKYLDTATVKTSIKFYNTTFPYDMIFTKSDVYTIYEKVETLNRSINIHYRTCIVSLIYLLSTIIYLSSCSTQVRTHFIKPW